MKYKTRASLFRLPIVVLATVLFSTQLTYGVGLPAITSVTSLSPTSGQAGTKVTITGTGFSTIKPNYIDFNNGAGVGTMFIAASSDGTTLEFTVPNYALGSYKVHVNNDDNGLSTTFQTFKLVASTPTVISLSPASGPPGTKVDVIGIGFATTTGATNAVKFTTEGGSQAGYITLGSASPVTPVLQFNVPNLPVGTYRITVGNSQYGEGTVYKTFKVNLPGKEPSVAIINPNDGESITLGSQYTIHWTNVNLPIAYLPDRPNFEVYLMDETGFVSRGIITNNLGASATSYVWTVGKVYADNDVHLTQPRTIPIGRYRMYVKEGLGINAVNVSFITITDHPTAPIPAAAPLSLSLVPTITSLYPVSGPAGTKVTITGTGFSTTKTNYVDFNNGTGGAVFNAISLNGTTLEFTVPNYTYGSYRTYVSNDNKDFSTAFQTFTLTAPVVSVASRPVSTPTIGGGGGGVIPAGVVTHFIPGGSGLSTALASAGTGNVATAPSSPPISAEERKALTEQENLTIDFYRRQYEAAVAKANLERGLVSTTGLGESLAVGPANAVGPLQTSMSAAVASFWNTVTGGVSSVGEQTARGGEHLFRKVGDFFKGFHPATKD